MSDVPDIWNLTLLPSKWIIFLNKNEECEPIMG